MNQLRGLAPAHRWMRVDWLEVLQIELDSGGRLLSASKARVDNSEDKANILMAWICGTI
jgi:hypothetical protein